MIQFGVIASSVPQGGTPGAVFGVSVSSPYARAWKWNGSSFGSQYTNPATTPNESTSIDITHTNDAVAIANYFSPYLIAYAWDMTTGWGAKYSNPSPTPSIGNIGWYVKFNPTSTAVALCMDGTGSPWQTPEVYAWSSSGFGTKYSNPATTIQIDDCRAVAFSPSNDAIMYVGTSTSIYVESWAWSDVTGFGARFSDPTTPITANAFAVNFNNSGNAVAIGFFSSPNLHVYSWSGSGFGSKFANPATAIPNSVLSVQFHPTDNAIAMGITSTSPYLLAYAWSGSGFGAKYANPASLPSNSVNTISFNPAGDWLATSNTSTLYMSAYAFSTATGFGGVRRPSLATQTVNDGALFSK